MSLELKPCPFCGGRAGFMSNAVDFQEVWGVSCDGECGAQIDSCAWDKEDAAEIWNQRSDAARQEGARGGEPVEHAPDCQSHIVDVRGRPDECTCGALASPAEPSGWRPIDQAPDLGRKIVALYGDGSGASMFWRHDGGYISADGDEWGELPDHYALWTYLPDSFQFWCEYRSDEPMTLTLPPTSEGGGA